MMDAPVIEITDEELDAMVGPILTIGLATRVRREWWRGRHAWWVVEVTAPWYERKSVSWGRNHLIWPIAPGMAPTRLEGCFLINAEGHGSCNRSMRRGFPVTVGSPRCEWSFTLNPRD
jgi:hypothetical protein